MGYALGRDEFLGALGQLLTGLADDVDNGLGGQVTGLPAVQLGAMIGRQLPFLAMLLPFYVMTLYGGVRSVKVLWPVLLVSGASFAIAQFVTSNFLDYALTDVLSSLSNAPDSLGPMPICNPSLITPE